MITTQEIERLKEFRARTLSTIARMREQLREEMRPCASTDDDTAGDLYERSKSISLIQGLEARIRSLDRAIFMASKGTYGLCEKCGAPILPERLQIIPETTLCVHCASELEKVIQHSQSFARAPARKFRAY